MTLTSHLQATGSPVRAYLDRISPSLAEGRGNTSGARTMSGSLGLTVLARCPTVVWPADDVDTARAGTAVDFRARIALGGFDPFESAAALGVVQLPAYAGDVANGAHRVRVLAEAFDIAARILQQPVDESELDRAALLLAHCEQVYRVGAKALDGKTGAALDDVGSGHGFASSLDDSSLADLRALMTADAPHVTQWRRAIAAGERYEPNPIFAGSSLVGGADADWLIGDTLIESKAYATVSVAQLRSFLRQLLGYTMLDLNDALGIRHVALWLPRQSVTRVWSLRALLGGDPEQLLPNLRVGFRTAASGKQLAGHELATERRK